MIEYRVSFIWHTGYGNALPTTRKFARQIKAATSTEAIEAVRQSAIKKGMPAHTKPNFFYPVWPQPNN